MIHSFFEKIFVINLDRRPDRFKAFLQQFDAAGMAGVWNIERFSAVDGSLPENAPPPEWSVQPGAWGCLQSHHAIIKRGIAEGWHNVLIFEDDAMIFSTETFRDDLTASLAELPSDWEQFYLGLEHFNQPTDVPTVLSPHIHRTANGNRTHAYALTATGMKIVDRLFADWRSWKRGWHCDWALGYALHRTGKIRVYNARPNLFVQRDGLSDINNKFHKIRSFGGFMENNFFDGPIRVKDSTVGYGKLCLNGQSGYDGKKFQTADRSDKIISAHAPSRLKIEVTKTVEIRGVLDTRSKPWVPCVAKIDGNPIGSLSSEEKATPPALLKRGTHTLEFLTDDNRSTMTGWTYAEPNDPVFEILSNCACPNACPACNQAEFMAAEPNYEYTPDDAAELVRLLEKNNLRRRVCFTGGEPGFWKYADEVMAIFNASEKISGSWVATSLADEVNFNRLKALFDTVCLSKRTGTAALIDSHPSWLDGVTIWDQRRHAVPLSIPDVTSVKCCCAQQGITASIFGRTVYPCVMARSLQLAGRWPELVGVPLEQYFASGLPQPIQSAPACFGCVNNLAYRQSAEKVLT